MNRKRISDVNSVHAAITSGPPTAVIGLSFKLNPHATNDAVPTAMSTGTSDSSERTTERKPHREEQEDEQDRQVGQQDAIGLEIVEQAHADDGQTRRSRADARGRMRLASHLATTYRRALLERGHARSEHDVERLPVRLRPKRPGGQVEPPRMPPSRRPRSARCR